MSVITELGKYNGRGDRHDSMASGSYDALPSTSGRLSSLEASSGPSQSHGSIADVSLTVHRHRRHRRPLFSDVTLPACSLGTSILLNLPCKYFHIPSDLFSYDQRKHYPHEYWVIHNAYLDLG